MSKIQLPAGFNAISGGGGDSVVWKTGKVVTGVVQEVKKLMVKVKKSKEFPKGEKPSRLMRIMTKDGEVTVWEKAALGGLFDAAKKGKVVYIQHTGMGKAKPGQSKPHTFIAGIKGK